jgi:hypothetical protein
MLLNQDWHEFKRGDPSTFPPDLSSIQVIYASGRLVKGTWRNEMLDYGADALARGPSRPLTQCGTQDQLQDCKRRAGRTPGFISPGTGSGLGRAAAFGRTP